MFLLVGATEPRGETGDPGVVEGVQSFNAYTLRTSNKLPQSRIRSTAPSVREPVLTPILHYAFCILHSLDYHERPMGDHTNLERDRVATRTVTVDEVIKVRYLNLIRLLLRKIHLPQRGRSKCNQVAMITPDLTYTILHYAFCILHSLDYHG